MKGGTKINNRKRCYICSRAPKSMQLFNLTARTNNLEVAADVVRKALGVVDVLLDIRGQGDITPLLPLVPQGLGKSRDTLAASSLHDLTSDDDAGLANTLNARVDETLVDLISVQGACKSRGRGVHHLVRDAGSLGEDSAETKTGEDVDVVALVGVICHGRSVLGGLGRVVAEGRAGGEDDSALGPVNSLLERALSLGQGVAQREQDGAAVRATSIDRVLESTDDGLGEDTKRGGQADQSAGLDVRNDFLEGLVLLASVVGTGKVLLVVGQVVAAVLGDETLGVHEPELVTGLSLAETALGVVFYELLGDTNTSRASTHEDETLLIKGNARQVHSTNVSVKVSTGFFYMTQESATYPPRTTAPVPWMSSLKQRCELR